jgi:hypothetical protein
MLETEKIGAGNTPFSCELCDYTCLCNSDYDKHISTAKHQKNVNSDIFVTFSDTKWKHKCQNCSKDFQTRAGLWKHSKTCNDQNNVPDFGNTSVTFRDNFVTNKKIGDGCLSCKSCGKEFKSRNGVWYHSKKCTTKNTSTHYPSDIVQITSLFIESMQKNQEFQKEIIGIIKDSGSVNNSHNMMNSHNKQKFNLNFFLNETCKDAMNLSEFVDSLKITLSDLENVGKLGYTEGISKIFTNGLKELDIRKRPIHCSDLKRETVYVKNANKWEKEGDQLNRAIKQITNKNIKLIPKWKEENPGHQQYNNKRNDDYLKIMYESMGPADDVEERKSYGKIIANLAKETTIIKS